MKNEELLIVNNNFRNNGFYGPISLFSSEKIRRILKLISNNQPAPMDWKKGHAVTSYNYYSIATDNKIINIIRSLLGEDIILWGASILFHNSKNLNCWLTDFETHSPNAQSVSLYISLESAIDNLNLKLLTGSHKFGKSFQETFVKSSNKELLDKELLEWARLKKANSLIEEISLSSGEACMLDGRVWYNIHLQHNTIALLFQYAKPDTSIRIPNYDSKKWPPIFKTIPKPPCLIISGNARKSQNRILPPPAEIGITKPYLTNLIHQLQMPLKNDIKTGWKSYRIFHGSSSKCFYFGCYISVLNQGKSPHIPHSHSAEELLIVLDGTIDIVIAKDSRDKNPKIENIKRNSCVYYPAYQYHTLYNSGCEPVTYLIFKWDSNKPQNKNTMGTNFFSLSPNNMSKLNKKNFYKYLLFEGRTKYLNKLHAHFSIIQPGFAYQPHEDSYEVAIWVLNGKLETLDTEIHSNSIILYGAGHSHGMRNIGNIPATYLVFEFH